MSKMTLTDGSPVTPGYRIIDPVTGQQRDYVVLSAEERAKSFVRPVRRTYLHCGAGATFNGSVLVKAGSSACGTRTTMDITLAQTYARDPHFYTGTFCVGCRAHFPLDQFVWDGTTEQVGS